MHVLQGSCSVTDHSKTAWNILAATQLATGEKVSCQCFCLCQNWLFSILQVHNSTVHQIYNKVSNYVQSTYQQVLKRSLPFTSSFYILTSNLQISNFFLDSTVRPSLLYNTEEATVATLLIKLANQLTSQLHIKLQHTFSCGSSPVVESLHI